MSSVCRPSRHSCNLSYSDQQHLVGRNSQASHLVPCMDHTPAGTYQVRVALLARQPEGCRPEQLRRVGVVEARRLNQAQTTAPEQGQPASLAAEQQQWLNTPCTFAPCTCSCPSAARHLACTQVERRQWWGQGLFGDTSAADSLTRTCTSRRHTNSPAKHLPLPAAMPPSPKAAAHCVKSRL